MDLDPYPLEHFERSWLQERLDAEAYFLRTLRSSVAQRRAWLREIIEANWQKVREVWRDGDELWYWRYYIPGARISGSAGLALLREGQPAKVWTYGAIL